MVNNRSYRTCGEKQPVIVTGGLRKIKQKGGPKMEDKESLKEFMLKEIDLIQDIIKRMASNSFMIKGWTITLVVATLLLKGSKTQVYIAFIPLITFWFLDAYFLWQERLYRKLYDWVITNRLNTNELLFSMNAYRFRDKVQSKMRIMFSQTLGWFYGGIIILVFIYSLALLLIKKG